MSKVSKSIRSAVEKLVEKPRGLPMVVLAWAMLVAVSSPQFLVAQDTHAKQGSATGRLLGSGEALAKQDASPILGNKSADSTTLEASKGEQSSFFDPYAMASNFFKQLGRELSKNQIPKVETKKSKTTELPSLRYAVPRSSFGTQRGYYQPRNDYRSRQGPSNSAQRDINRFQRQLQNRLAPRGVRF